MVGKNYSWEATPKNTPTDTGKEYVTPKETSTSDTNLR